jgi:CHAT domain-containing protein
MSSSEGHQKAARSGLRHASGYAQLLLWIVTLAWSLLNFSGLTQAKLTQQSGELRPLSPTVAVERELAGGQTHLYQIALAAGQFVQVEIEPSGIALVMEFIGVDGKTQAKTDGSIEHKTLRLVADSSGDYRLAIGAAEKTAAAGRYKVTLVEVRQATQRDRESVAGDQLLKEGAQLTAQGNKEAQQAALKKYEEALARYRTAEDREYERNTLSRIGDGYFNLGDLPRALEFMQQSLAVARAIGERQGEAYALLNIGAFHGYLGDSQKALESFQQALSLSRSLGDKRGEGGVLASMGSIYQRLGQYEQAREALAQSLPLLQAVGDKRGEGVIQNNLGALYRNMGNSPKALEHYLQALPLLRASGEKNVEATTLDNLGVLYRTQDDLPQALNYFNQALTLRRTLGNKRGEAVTLDNLGAVYQRMGESRKALEHHQQALPLLQAIGDVLKSAVTLNNIGNAQRSLGDFNQALESHQQAWQLLQATGDRIVQADTLRKKAEAERELGKFTEARADIEQAIALLEFIRASVGNEAERAAFFATVADFYEFNIDLLMQMQRVEPQGGHAAAALQVTEQARARSLLELLSETRANLREGVPAALLERERDLRKRVTASLDSLNKLLSGKHTKEQRTAAEKELNALTDEYRKVQTEIRRTSPHYAAFTQPQPLTVAEIQKQLDEDTLLLEYALGEKRSYLWLVSTQSVASYELPPRKEIETAARKVYELLTARQPQAGLTETQQRARIAAAEAAFPAQAAALSRMLLAPVAAQLGQKRLAIVAVDALAYLPFAALPDPAAPEQPMLTAHEIVNLPSASVLAVLRSEVAGRGAAEKAVAVLADPVFEANDPRVTVARQNGPARKGEAKLTTKAQSEPTALTAELGRALRAFNPTPGEASTRSQLTRLPFSREEAEAIAALVPAERVLKVTGFQANRATATKPDLGRYRIVHFATHGLLNAERPELSGLVFSLVDEMGKAQDGFLRLHEIYNLRLPVEVVVLSACQTALGKEVKGEGLIGLTRGFMYAGAPRIAASLWQVDDLATAELMKRFYTGMLKDGLRPAAALRTAQLGLLKQKRYGAPFYWAAFVLQGEWK